MPNNSVIYVNRISNRSGIYQLFDAEHFDSNNQILLNETEALFRFSNANSGVRIEQTGTGNSITANNFIVDASGSVTSGTLSSSVNFPTGHMKLLNFSQIGYGPGLTMDTILISLDLTGLHQGSKVYLTGSVNLERISADTTDSAQISIDGDDMTTILVDGSVGYGAADSQNIHIPFACLSDSITADSTSFDIRLHGFTGTAEFNVNGGTVTAFEVFS